MRANNRSYILQTHIDKQHIGGCDDLCELDDLSKLKQFLRVILLATVQSFLTLIIGDSAAGKTTPIHEIAEVLGQDNVTVETWSSSKMIASAVYFSLKLAFFAPSLYM